LSLKPGEPTGSRSNDYYRQMILVLTSTPIRAGLRRLAVSGIGRPAPPREEAGPGRADSRNGSSAIYEATKATFLMALVNLGAHP
jgi:hypothetical protein